MTPKLKKELNLIFDKNEKQYPAGTITSAEYIRIIIMDIENHTELKEAKFKLSFWKNKNPNNVKYSVCKGHCIQDVIKSWSDVDPNYLVTFVLFGDN